MSRISKLFTGTLVLSPILMMYHISKTSSITFLDVMLVLLVISMSINNLRKGRIKKDSIVYELIPYLLYIVFHFLLMVIFKYNQSQIIDIGLRTFRYSFYLIIVIFFVKDYFDSQFGIKLFKVLVIFAAIYFFAQIVLLRTFNFYLKGYLPFLPVTRENLLLFSETATYSRYTRVRSIFGEISQFSISLSGFLCLSMFRKNSFNEIKTQIFLTMGLLLSISSLGVLSAISIWVAWIVYKSVQNRDRLSINLLFFIMVLIFGLVGFVTFSSSYELFAGRLGNSTFNRFGSYYDYITFIQNTSGYEMIFGQGMDTSVLAVWYPSIAKILRFFGIAGFTIFSVSIMMLFYRIKSNFTSIVLLSFFIFLGFGTEVLIGNFLLLYFPFILIKDQEKNNFSQRVE